MFSLDCGPPSDQELFLKRKTVLHKELQGSAPDPTGLHCDSPTGMPKAQTVALSATDTASTTTSAGLGGQYSREASLAAAFVAELFLSWVLLRTSSFLGPSANGLE